MAAALRFPNLRPEAPHWRQTLGNCIVAARSPPIDRSYADAMRTPLALLPLALTACGAEPSKPPAGPPAHAEVIAHESELLKLTLTAQAQQRLGIGLARIGSGSASAQRQVAGENRCSSVQYQRCARQLADQPSTDRQSTGRRRGGTCPGERAGAACADSAGPRRESAAGGSRQRARSRRSRSSHGCRSGRARRCAPAAPVARPPCCLARLAAYTLGTRRCFRERHRQRSPRGRRDDPHAWRGRRAAPCPPCAGPALGQCLGWHRRSLFLPWTTATVLFVSVSA